jgi:hypothetical protein
VVMRGKPGEGLLSLGVKNQGSGDELSLASGDHVIVCVKFCKLMRIMGLAVTIMRPRGAEVSDFRPWTTWVTTVDKGAARRTHTQYRGRPSSARLRAVVPAAPIRPDRTGWRLATQPLTAGSTSPVVPRTSLGPWGRVSPVQCLATDSRRKPVMNERDGMPEMEVVFEDD